MKQIAQSYKTGELKIVDVPSPSVPRGGILVETAASLISAGTERMLIDLARKNLLQKAKSRPDLVTKVIEKVKREGALAALETVRSKLDSPIPLGYSLAGRITAVGQETTGLAVGDRVACAGAGYANHAQANAVPQNLAVPIPTNVSDEEAAFVTVGAIALQGVRLVKPTLGEVVAVIGLGLLGQIAASLLRAHGCDVIAMDKDPNKVSLAIKRGAIRGATIGTDDPQAVVRAISRGRGVDSVVITASSSTNDPLVLAGDIARERAKISIVGFMPLEIPRQSYYEKELEVVVSRSYGPGRYDPDYEERGIDYPLGYVRWTEQRNLQAVVNAIASQRLDVKGLITHRFDFDNVMDAYALITGEKSEPHLGIVLTYPPDINKESELNRAPVIVRHSSGLGKVGIAVVGTGSFATSVLLPKLTNISRACLVATASGRGLSANHAAERFGAKRVAQSFEEILQMDDVEVVVIATRHNTHASMAAKALRAGKSVFLEKPAAINNQQLAELQTAVKETQGRIMVGFNRRFAPFAKAVKEAFAARTTGLIMQARINAGAIPKGNWITTSDEGGGRIVGEGCHFIDLFSYWSGSFPYRVSAHSIGPGGGYSRDDNMAITLSFGDGSVGSLIYTSMGDSSIGKECYEVISEGHVAQINDWRKLTTISGGKTKNKLALKANKGHQEELEAFLDACWKQKPSPIDWESIEATTLATFYAERSWREQKCL